MKDTIIDLWYGNIAPCEHCGSHDPKASKLIHLFYMIELAFQEGFVIASKLTAESLQQ